MIDFLTLALGPSFAALLQAMAPGSTIPATAGSLRGTLSIVSANTANPMIATGSVAVSVGDLVFVVMTEQNVLTSTGVTDNLGNTYVAQSAGLDTVAGVSGRAFWSRVTVAGTLTSVSVAAGSGSGDSSVAVAVIEGPFQVSPLDKNPALNNDTDNASPFACPASGTLSQADEVVICWMSQVGASSVYTANAPNLLALSVGNSAFNRGNIGYQRVSSTASVSPEFAGANSTSSIQGTSTFKL